MRKCKDCGGKIENPNSNVALCFACRLAAYLPAWYESAEGYYIDPVHHIPRARYTPATGVALLDAPHASRVPDGMRGD